jgi:hypothetical protein
MRRASELYGSTPRAFKDETADCSVRAVAVAANVPYERAHALFERHGRERKRRTPVFISDRVCHDLFMEEMVIVNRPTLAQFIREHREGRFFLSRGGHAFALVNGVVHDWAASRTGPRSRIKRAWRAKA